MTTNYQRIIKLDCRKLAEFISEFDMFCSMCSYNLEHCKKDCITGHEIWLSQKYEVKKDEKEKLPRGRGEKYGLFKR